MINFSASVDGVPVLDRSFSRIDHYISDLRSVWPAVADEFYAMEVEQFASEGASGASGQWAGLSNAYAIFKAREFPGATILQATGGMLASLTDREAPDAIYISEPHQLTLGSKDPKAIAHHRGLGNLPARPVISPSEARKRLMQKAIQRQLVRFTRSLGFEVEERAA